MAGDTRKLLASDEHGILFHAKQDMTTGTHTYIYIYMCVYIYIHLHLTMYISKVAQYICMDMDIWTSGTYPSGPK